MGKVIMEELSGRDPKVGWCLNVSVLSTTGVPAPPPTPIPTPVPLEEHLAHLTEEDCCPLDVFVLPGGGSCRELNRQRDFLFGSHLVGVQ